MRLKSIGVFMVLGLLGLGLVSTSAFAGKKGATEAADMTMQQIGVPSLDAYFGKAGDMVNAVVTARTNIQTANANINTVLGLKEGTPVADALADLKTKAAGKIKVGMKGNVPTLEPSEAIPENVQAGIDAVNGLLAALGSTAEAMKVVTTNAPALVTEGKALVSKVPAEAAAAGLKVTQVPGAVKAFGKNLDIIVSLPGESKKLVDESVNTFNIVKSVFGS
jgi:hypothetical protein